MQVAPLFDGFLFQIVKAADKFFVGAFEGVFGIDVVEACGVDEDEKQVAKFGFHAVVVVVVYFGLKFGYLLYEDPEASSASAQTTHFYAVPVWQLDCLYLNNPRAELPEYGQDETGDEQNSLEYANLIINAQTGEAQDFMSEKEDRALYQGFLSWEDVQAAP